MKASVIQVPTINSFYLHTHFWMFCLVLKKVCLHSVTSLGRKPSSDTSLHPAYIPRLAFNMSEKRRIGVQRTARPNCSLRPSLRFLKAAKTWHHPSNQSLQTGHPRFVTGLLSSLKNNNKPPKKQLEDTSRPFSYKNSDSGGKKNSYSDSKS